MTENERLRIIRTKLNLTQKTFSESLEIKQGSYSDVERGKAGISALLLKNLIRKYRVNPLWLCEGEGSMFVGETPDWAQSTSFEPSDNQPDEKECTNQLLQRQQQYIQSIKEVVDFLA
ncbi:MAG: helix-turn-helix transcriptional regulator [Tenuifilaceae bacterium]|jgi:transcriptional regulator with XRE-family HTH domain|uniref:helix-turn-helix domain-containing protein n=1 Tax=Perlabentimonas gracilis TaxID=2715279 RepID=UPI001407E6D4|nr:helix-turn-helix transcriptional regulator [Perlabentimonas gracilis]MDX9769268.1 helix-turn-helix transcriptional regulator [Tenuifilaceae bacterium]NHB69011.1 helix-turn-helix transcriptional regulator [Perlabentimonas gracilis]